MLGKNFKHCSLILRLRPLISPHVLNFYSFLQQKTITFIRIGIISCDCTRTIRKLRIQSHLQYPNANERYFYLRAYFNS